MRPEDQEAAMSMIGEHPFLKNDDYAKRVIETGKADNGVEVDLGNFLAARAAVLEEAVAKEKLSKIDPATVEVAYSVRPDVEKYVN